MFFYYYIHHSEIKKKKKRTNSLEFALVYIKFIVTETLWLNTEQTFGSVLAKYFWV